MSMPHLRFKLHKHIISLPHSTMMISTMPLVSFLLLISLFACHAAVCQGLEDSKYAVSQLPNLSFQLPSSWAGEIRIPGTEDELFFWLFAGETSKVEENLISENLTAWVTVI